MSGSTAERTWWPGSAGGFKILGILALFVFNSEAANAKGKIREISPSQAVAMIKRSGECPLIPKKWASNPSTSKKLPRIEYTPKGLLVGNRLFRVQSHQDGDEREIDKFRGVLQYCDDRYPVYKYYKQIEYLNWHSPPSVHGYAKKIGLPNTKQRAGYLKSKEKDRYYGRNISKGTAGGLQAAFEATVDTDVSTPATIGVLVGGMVAGAGIVGLSGAASGNYSQQELELMAGGGLAAMVGGIALSKGLQKKKYKNSRLQARTKKMFRVIAQQPSRDKTMAKRCLGSGDLTNFERLHACRDALEIASKVKDAYPWREPDSTKIARLSAQAKQSEEKMKKKAQKRRRTSKPPERSGVCKNYDFYEQLGGGDWTRGMTNFCYGSPAVIDRTRCASLAHIKRKLCLESGG